MMSPLSRFILLLALLPQLLVLGLGRGVVLCVAPGGHVQIEATASACCVDTNEALPESAFEGEWASDSRRNCGSCDDLSFAVDTFIFRAHDGTDLNNNPLAALPVETTAFRVRGQLAFVVPRGPASDLEPRHLHHLRSVLQRC